MINAVGRDIPQEVIDATGKKVFEGVYAYDNYEYKKLHQPFTQYVIQNAARWLRISMTH